MDHHCVLLCTPCPRQLGYKSVKFLTRLTVTDNLKKFGKGLGSESSEEGYVWYAGI